MLRKIIIALLLCSSAAYMLPLYATPEAELHNYIKEQFQSRILITPQQITQLTWVMQHSRHSNDMDMHVAQPEIHIEVSRALTRLYCMHLLKLGTKAAYEEFVVAQLGSNIEIALTFNSFKKLSKYLQNLCDEDYELLQTATILAAVSLSDHAAILAQEFMLQHELHDNLDFLSKTLRLDVKMYPLAQKYADDKAAAKKLLYVLFPPQTNFRHMLYTEGGIGMFNYLRSMIQHQYVNQDDLDFWYAYWIVNIAGFRGHVAHQGSIYLTEPVFQAMSELKKHIDQMLYTPNYNPLVPYLDYRATMLGLQNISQEQRSLLAHIGALLRMYSSDDGEILKNEFAKLSVTQQRQISKFFMQGLQDYQRNATTYLPAVFANVLELLHGNKAKAIAVVLPIYSRAVALYIAKKQAGEIHPDLALNFNNLSATNNLRRILELGSMAAVHLNINVSAEVLLD